METAACRAAVTALGVEEANVARGTGRDTEVEGEGAPAAAVGSPGNERGSGGAGHQGWAISKISGPGLPLPSARPIAGPRAGVA